MDTKPDLALDTFRGPKYKRLYHALEKAVRTGNMEVGRKLPPVRELAWQLGITPGTVARAYQMGVDEGLLEATVGRGTFVKGTHRTLPDIPPNLVATPTQDGFLNFRNGHTLELGQSELIRTLSMEILQNEGINFAGYARDHALAGCREAASSWLNESGVTGDSADLVLTHGAHNSVMVALNSVLNGRDPAIATTELIYPGFCQTAHISRARMIGIRSDAEGILPDSLEFACRQDRVQVLLISSNVHNPTCAATPYERRLEIAEIARRHDIQIIEDDVYGTLIRDKPEGFDQLCPERTWHATSLSKCFAAGLRIGFLRCPPGFGARGMDVMQGLSLSISHLLTRITEQSFLSGAVADFGARVAATNKARTDLAKEVLKKWDVHSRDGVNYVWTGLPAGWTCSTLTSACEAEKLLVAAADKFALPGRPAPNAVRLTLSMAADLDALRSGLETFDAILANPPRNILT